MITRRCFKYWRYTHCAKGLLLYAVPIQLVMSSTDSQVEFRGGTPYYADYACREEAQVAPCERSTIEELGHLRKGWAKSCGVVVCQRHCSGAGEDFLTPRVDGKSSTRLRPVAYWWTSSLPRDMFSGGRLGLRDKPQDQTQGQTL